MPEAMLTLHNEDKTLTFKAKADWKENSFNLTILAKKAWQTQVSEEDINKLASERNQSTKDYYSTLQGYLSNVNPDVFFNLIYKKNVNGEDEEAEFTISYKTGSRVLLFFVTKLKQMDFHESIYKILDDLMEKHNELAKCIQLLQKEKEDIQKEKNAYEDKLIEFIERKSKWEQEMYSNFLLLLNEKKKRIRFLTNILKRKNIDPDQQPLEPELRLTLNKKNKRSDLMEQLSESESSNYTESDDDNDTDRSEPENMERHEPTPSSSRLDLDEEECGDGHSHLLVPKRVKDIENENDDVTMKITEDGCKENDLEENLEVLSPQLEFSTQDLYNRL